MKQFNVGLALSGCLALHSALAGGPEIPQFMAPMTPGVSVAGNFIDFNSGWADALIPVFRTTPSSFLYLDPQGLYHNNDQYSASIGGGFRMLTQSAGILGAYVFGDYNHSQQNNEYWFVSPGLERLGDTLDFSVNGYFPVSSQRNNTTSGFASQFGDTDDIFFSGHNEVDTIVQNFESTGVGVDGEIGYRLPFLHNNTKLYLGGYYFSPKDNDSITGGIAKLEVPVNSLLSLTVGDAYDNIFHNTFRAGASLSLWGRSTHFHNHSIETRMVDPIQRNRIAQEGHSGTDQYITEGQEDIGTGILLSNIWFFAPGGTPGPLLADSSSTPTTVSLNQCIAEHPCAATDVNTDFFAGINAVASNAKMFLAPGTYNNLDNGAGTGTLIVDAGQSMYGRTADYKYAAVDNARALLIGSLDLQTNSIINALRLANNDGLQTQAIVVEDSAQNIQLVNLLIGNTGNTPGEAYSIGVIIGNNNTVSISNSEFDSVDNTFQGSAISLESNGTGNQINIAHSAFTSNQTNTGLYSADIVDNVGGNDWQLTNNQFTSTALNGNGFNLTVSNILFLGSVPGTMWTLKNNQMLASDPGDPSPILVGNIDERASTSTSFGGNTWTITGNQLTISNTLAAAAINSSDSNNVWNIIDNTMLTGGGAVQNLFDKSSRWTLSGNEMDGVITNESNGGDIWTVTNNTITKFGSGVEVIQEFGFGDIWNLTGNRIIVNSSGDTVGGAVIEDSPGGNSWTLTNNTISVSSSNASNVTEGIIKMQGESVSDTWVLNQNQFTLTTSGANVKAIGIQNNAGVWTMGNNQINVTNTATGTSPAYGFLIIGNLGTITSSQDTLAIHSAQIAVAQTGFGFAANSNATTATNSTISVSNDIIGVTADGVTYGIFDPNAAAATPNHNTWNPGNNTAATLNAANTITVSHTGAGQICRVLLGTTCVP